MLSASKSLIILSALAVMSAPMHAACYINDVACPIYTQSLGDRVAHNGPGAGCHFIYHKLKCKGGNPSAKSLSNSLEGYKELGDKCGQADREEWYWDGVSLTPGVISTNYCIVNVLATPSLIGTEPNYVRCGEKVAIGAFGPCQPNL